MALDGLLATLDDEGRLAAAVVAGLPPDAFARPTRYPPWDVRILVGHMVRDLERVVAALDEPPPDAAATDAVSYFRNYDPRAAGPGITARAMEAAGGFDSTEALARGFDEMLRRCVEAAEAHDPARLLRTRVTTIRLDEFLKTRILEIGVHGLDLADALDRDPWLSPAAASLIRGILTGLLGDDPSAALGWTDLTYIETGTGRRPLTDAERSFLGPRANAFPLLG
ncbi:MAG: maleylpyruvate isomerase N-terminal domain-containing protein [Actinomycetota bacterium]